MSVFDNKDQVFSGEINAEALEIGRQRPDEKEPYSLSHGTGSTRLIIARLNEAAVSRSHAYLKGLENDRVLVKNQSNTQLTMALLVLLVFVSALGRQSTNVWIQMCATYK